jgi:hypothetical protein
MKLLGDREWAIWANREIARRCGVDESFVRKLKPEPLQHTADKPQYQPTTFMHPKTGKPTQMNTAAIGRRLAP